MRLRMAFFSAISFLLADIRFYSWIVVLKFSNAGIASVLNQQYNVTQIT